MKLRFMSVILKQNPILHNGSQKCQPDPKRARQVCFNVKVMLAVFFDCEGVIHHGFISCDLTVNKEFYLNMVKRLREAVRRKRPDFFFGGGGLLHHDNAPVHSPLPIYDYLTKCETTIILCTLYSPDHAPADFFLFTKLKS
jgi:hypothetical protein